jgi:hypothetical protein
LCVIQLPTICIYKTDKGKKFYFFSKRQSKIVVKFAFF